LNVGRTAKAGKPAAKRSRAAAPLAAGPRPLSPKQARFVDEYLIDLNATKAAERAGYSARTAYSIGQENLTKPDILAAVAERKAARAKRTGIDADWVLARLADEAEADIADIYDDLGSIKPVHEWPLVWRRGLVAGVEVAELFEGKGDDREHIGQVRKIRLSDRLKRIELIGKHIGVQAFKERVEVDASADLAAMLTKARERVLSGS
jgi:phage terminase small subunit